MTEYMTTYDVAELLGVSRRRVNAMITAGVLKSDVFNGTHLIRRADVDAEIERRKQKADGLLGKRK